MKFYIATYLERAADHNLVRDILIRRGHKITYDWTTHGSVKEQGEARISQVCQNELRGVRDADFVVGLLPGGRGTHGEIGAAGVLEKPMFLHATEGNEALFGFTDKTCAFYWSPDTVRIAGGSVEGFANRVADILDQKHDLIREVEKTLENYIGSQLPGDGDKPAVESGNGVRRCFRVVFKEGKEPSSIDPGEYLNIWDEDVESVAAMEVQDLRSGDYFVLHDTPRGWEDGTMLCRASKDACPEPPPMLGSVECNEVGRLPHDIYHYLT